MSRDLKNIAVLVSGGGTNLQALIDSIERGEIKGKISVIISNKNSYALERGKNHNIKTYFISDKSISNEEYEINLLEILQEEKIDLVVLAGYLKILGENFINKYKNKIINIHPSLIPSFCGDGFYGIKIHEEVLKYGCKITGATTHFVNEETDGGPIIMQKSVEVSNNETVESLQQKVLKLEHEILVESVKEFCNDNLEIDGRIVKRLKWKKEL